MALTVPKHLTRSSKALYKRVAGDYRLEREAHALETLRLACEALGRAEEARQRIATDGPYYSDRFGQPKVHPALGVERDSRLAPPLPRTESRRRGATGGACPASRRGPVLVPVRPRRRRRRGEWDPAVALAVTSGAAPSRPQPTRAVLREAWTEQGAFLIATATDIAELAGFWAFEEVPAALREEPPVLYPAGEAEAVREARDGLITRRRAWLLEHRPDLDR